ncbi:MAG: efflux RND transporter periplasmic adaptor subunit [Spirochaetaceae bacterium]
MRKRENACYARCARSTVAVAAVLVSLGCAPEQQDSPRTAEEIHETDGVPVAVRTVEPTEFATYLRFMGTLSGTEETTATARVTDRVEAVLHEVGEYVEADTPVVIFPPEDASINYEQARLQFESARQRFERVQRLYESEGVSRQDLDDARTQYEIARADWESVRDMAEVGAPISGYITRINVSETDNVTSGEPLFTVTADEGLTSTVWLTDGQVGEVSRGQPAEAAWQGTTLEGRITQVDMAMDRRRGAFAAKLRFDNPERVVKSGVSAPIRIQTSRTDDAVILRDRDARRDADGRFVYVEQDGRAVKRYVEVAAQQGLYIHIADGLDPGDRVITTGANQVGDGSAVQVVEEESPLVQDATVEGAQ